MTIRPFPPRRRTPPTPPALAVAAAAVLSGCYDYIATPGRAPTAGSEVRVQLTDLGTGELAAQLGPNVGAIDGGLISAGDTLILRVARTATTDGSETDWRGERVAVPMRVVASVRQRQISRTRTALAALAGVGLAVAAVVAGRAGGASEGSGGATPLPAGQ